MQHLAMNEGADFFLPNTHGAAIHAALPGTVNCMVKQ